MCLETSTPSPPPPPPSSPLSPPKFPGRFAYAEVALASFNEATGTADGSGRGRRDGGGGSEGKNTNTHTKAETIRGKCDGQRSGISEENHQPVSNDVQGTTNHYLTVTNRAYVYVDSDASADADASANAGANANANARAITNADKERAPTHAKRLSRHLSLVCSPPFGEVPVPSFSCPLPFSCYFRISFRCRFRFIVFSYRTRGVRERWHSSSSYRGMWLRNRNARLYINHRRARMHIKAFFQADSQASPPTPRFHKLTINNSPVSLNRCCGESPISSFPKI